VSYSEEALDSLRIREIKMSFLDVFPLCLFHPSTNVFSPKKEETGTEIKKKESPIKVLTSFHLTSHPISLFLL
jgi:hypothetical protein